MAGLLYLFGWMALVIGFFMLAVRWFRGSGITSKAHATRQGIALVSTLVFVLVGFSLLASEDPLNALPLGLYGVSVFALLLGLVWAVQIMVRNTRS